MRVLLVCVVVLCALGLTQAKLVSVTGQGVILNTPPTSVFDKGPNDSSSEYLNGALAITAFDEKQGVVLNNPITIATSPTITLQPGVAYDSFFLFFHLKSNITDERVSAAASFTIDNRVVGCTKTISDEFETTPFFGLTSQTQYPLLSSQVSSIRGYEAADGVVGAGTVFDSQNNIGQPGDYTRCFSASCVDDQGGACQCSASSSNCIISSPDKYKCFASAEEIIALPGFHFSSTCLVDQASVQAEVASCSASNGCVRKGNSICLRGAASSVDLHITAGCGCDETITASFVPQASGANCVVPDETLCKNSSNILIYGVIDTTFPPWLRNNIPGSTVTQILNTPVTRAFLTPYDLVIFAQLGRVASAAESQAVLDYLNDGGASITLAGFVNTVADRTEQESIFQSIGIDYGAQLISLDDTVGAINYNSANPLTPGLAPNYIDFQGGWASKTYTGPGTSEIFASGVSIYDSHTYSIGQTITLPSGGRIVTWGDEWITFTGRFTLPNNADAQFWRNAVSWSSGICVPASNPCGSEKFVVSASCETASHVSSGKGFTLSFSSAASNCN